MRALVALSLAILAAGCASRDGPDEAARAFWEAARAGDTERLEALSARGGTARINADRDLQYEDLELDEPVVEGDSARIGTAMTLVSDERDDMRITFDTRLVRQDGWKVDLDGTMGAMVGALLGTSVRDLAEGVGRAAGSAMRGFVEGFRDAAAARGDSLVARDTAR